MLVLASVKFKPASTAHPWMRKTQIAGPLLAGGDSLFQVKEGCYTSDCMGQISGFLTSYRAIAALLESIDIFSRSCSYKKVSSTFA